jgi:hypothetical protein
MKQEIVNAMIMQMIAWVGIAYQVTAKTAGEKYTAICHFGGSAMVWFTGKTAANAFNLNNGRGVGNEDKDSLRLTVTFSPLSGIRDLLASVITTQQDAIRSPDGYASPSWALSQADSLCSLLKNGGQNLWDYIVEKDGLGAIRTPSSARDGRYSDSIMESIINGQTAWSKKQLDIGSIALDKFLTPKGMTAFKGKTLKDMVESLPNARNDDPKWTSFQGDSGIDHGDVVDFSNLF